MLADAITFERFRLLPRQRALHESGVPVRVGPRALDILIRLVDAEGEIVSTRDLLTSVWPDVIVDPAALRVHLSALRKVLGAAADGGPLVINVPGRGYRLAAEFRRDPAGPQLAPASLGRLERLFGREDLIQSLLEDLARRQFVSLVGPGGVGKTAMAQTLVAHAAPAYAQVAVVDLGAIGSDAAVPQAAVLAFRQAFGEADPQAALATFLRGKRALLVLDNCEHVIDATTTLAEALCAAAPGLDILTTSREPLRARGEWVCRVPPLTLPPDDGRPMLARVRTCPSTQLFLERARARGCDFDLDEIEAAAIVDICRRVEGLPLAIELAAGWCELYPPSALAGRLDGGLLLRGVGRRDGPARQRSLRTLVDWSYNLLKPDEQALFRRLSVFTGDFTPEAAIAVSGADESDALATLRGLVAKSLVAPSRRSEGVAYHLLMAPRAYGADALAQGGEAQATHRRRLIWVVSRLRDLAARWRPEARSEGLLAYIALVDEVRAAAAWALSSDGDAELARQLACESVPLWFHCSLPFEGRALCEQALEAFEAKGEGGVKALQLRTAYGVTLMFARSPKAPPGEVWRQVLDVATREGLAESQMLAHWGLWLETWLQGDLRAQLGHAQAFAELAERRDSADDRTMGQRMLAAANYALGRIDLAAEGLERMLAGPKERCGAPAVVPYQMDHVSSAQTLLARVLWLRGRPGEAMTMAKVSVEGAVRSGHGLSLAFALLEGPAHMGLLTGDAPAVHAALDRYLAMPETHGIRGAASVDAMRALAWALEGEDERACQAIATIFAQPAKATFVARFPTLIGQLSDFLVGQGKIDLAEALVTDARGRFVSDEDNVIGPELVRAAAVIAYARGNQVQAIGGLRLAAKEASRRGLTAWGARAMDCLARMETGSSA